MSLYNFNNRFPNVLVLHLKIIPKPPICFRKWVLHPVLCIISGFLDLRIILSKVYYIVAETIRKRVYRFMICHVLLQKTLSEYQIEQGVFCCVFRLNWTFFIISFTTFFSREFFQISDFSKSLMRLTIYMYVLYIDLYVQMFSCIFCKRGLQLKFIPKIFLNEIENRQKTERIHFSNSCWFRQLPIENILGMYMLSRLLFTRVFVAALIVFCSCARKLNWQKWENINLYPSMFK